MIREIEINLQVGPRHTGHTRDIYAGNGIEIWHEVIVPWNPLRMIVEGITERAFVFVASLPEEKPEGATFCGELEAFYSDGLIPQIHWEGKGCLDKAIAWGNAYRDTSHLRPL